MRFRGLRKRGKALVLGAILLLSTATPALAQQVFLEIGPSPDERVTGYMIYWRNSKGDIGYMNVQGNLTYEITNVVPETYEFYATAYDVDGNESGPSNTITWTKVQDKIPAGEDVPIPTEIEANFGLVIKEEAPAVE